MIRVAAIGFLILSAFILAAAPVARAARLRPYVTIGGSTVHLSDLFSGLDPGQDCTLGPAPSPGAQIVVGGAQLQAIADEFGVSWNTGQGAQSVVLSRPGENLSRDTVANAVLTALISLGMIPGSDLTLTGWTDTVVDPGSRLSVRTPVFDPNSGRFSATLSLSFDERETSEILVTGTATAMAATIVAARPIMAGEILSGEDFVTVIRPRNQLSQDALGSIADAVGLISTRPVPKGEAIVRSTLRAPPLVVRGSVVMIRLTGAGLSLSAGGLAVDTGAFGDRVRVVNPSSKAVLVGTVSDRGTVTIDADSAPMIVGNGVSDAALPPGFPGRTNFAAYAGTLP